jgi:DNA-binding FadR family transcriptional regulator
MRERSPEAARKAMHDHLIETQKAQRLEEKQSRKKDLV